MSAATFILVLALSLLIVLSLSVLGGGGSILTVPIQVYIAGFNSKEAIAASLFEVAPTANSEAALAPLSMQSLLGKSPKPG